MIRNTFIVSSAFFLFLLTQQPTLSLAAGADGINTANDKTLPIGAGGREIMYVVPKEDNTSGLDVDAIGIGTSNPAAKLDVAGGVKIGTVAKTDCKATTKGTLSYFDNDPYTNAVVKAIYHCDGTTWKRNESKDFCFTSSGGCPSTSSGQQIYTVATRGPFWFGSNGSDWWCNNAGKTFFSATCCTSSQPTTYPLVDLHIPNVPQQTYPGYIRYTTPTCAAGYTLVGKSCQGFSLNFLGCTPYAIDCQLYCLKN